MKKKLLSILLCLVMVAGSLPTAAFAAGYVEINETNSRMQSSEAL